MAASVQVCLSGPRTPEASLADHIRAASEAGFAALDLWAPTLDAYLATYPVIWLDMELQKHHVYATSISGIALRPSDAREDRAVQEARFLELCTHLDALGGGTIVLWPGAGQEEAPDDAQAVPWLVHMLKRCSDLAAPFEARIAFEFQAGASSGVRTLAASQEVVRQVARGNVGLAFDVGQLGEGGSGSEDVETLDVNKLWLVRLKSDSPQFPTMSQRKDPAGSEASPSPVPTGEGWGGGPTPTALQLTICQRLTDKGFRGPYCVEWPTLAATTPQSAGQDSLIERARQSRQAALELLASR